MYGLVTVWTSIDDGPYWITLLKYGSHGMRHTGFRRLTVVNRTPGFWGVTLSFYFLIYLFFLRFFLIYYLFFLQLLIFLPFISLFFFLDSILFGFYNSFFYKFLPFFI